MDRSHSHRQALLFVFLFCAIVVIGRSEDLIFVGSAGGGTTTVAMRAPYVYFGEASTLAILDVSDSSHPTVVSRLRLPNVIVEVAITGNIVAVADTDRLVLVDVTDPRFPSIVSTVITTSCQGVSASGEYVYILRYGEIKAYSIANPASPVERKTIGSGNAVFDVEGNIFAGARDTYGLYLYESDVTMPYGTLNRGSYRTYPKVIEDIILSNGYAYLALGSYGVGILDVRNPDSPSFEGYSEAGGYAQGLALIGSHLLVAGDAVGLQILDISDPARPVRIGFSNEAIQATSVAVDSNLICVADGIYGLKLFDASDLTNPELIDRYLSTGDVLRVALSGSLAYVTSRDSGLHIYDVSDPSLPRPLSSYQTLVETFDISLQGSLAYLSESYGGMEVVDVSDPRHPKPVSRYRSPQQAGSVVAHGNRAYLTDIGSGLEVLDVTEPSSPRRIGNLRPPQTWVSNLADHDNLLFLSEDGLGVEIWDTTDPLRLAKIGAFGTDKSYNVLHLSWPIVYLGLRYSSGLAIFDVSDPRTPRSMGTYPTANVYGITTSGDRLYIGLLERGLEVADISDPTHPSRIAQYDDGTKMSSYSLAASGPYVYAALQDRGLQVFRLVSGPTLEAPRLFPRKDSPGDTFVWSVGYRDDQGEHATTSTLVLDGQPRIMTYVNSASDFGIYASAPVQLSAGTHQYAFEFRAASGTSTRLPDNASPGDQFFSISVPMSPPETK